MLSKRSLGLCLLVAPFFACSPSGDETDEDPNGSGGSTGGQASGDGDAPSNTGGSSSGGSSSGGSTGSGGDSGTGGAGTAAATYCKSFYNSSGGSNPCYIGTDGKAHCIQVDGTTVTLSSVPGTAVSVTGWDYTTRACAVNDSGAIYCGDYGSMTEWLPSGGTQVSGLANGQCALVSGAIQCSSVSVPDTVTLGPGNVTLLGCYSDGCCAATDAPGLYCWGDTSENLGIDSDDPVQVMLPEGKQVLQIAAGQVHLCALLEGGQVQCWGQDWNGQLGGLGANMGGGVTLVESGAIGVAAGQFHTCVALEDGSVECAGTAGVHGAGQNSGTLAAVPDISTAIAITGGRYASCALLSDFSIECWGDYGDAGAGNNETTTPVDITGPSAAPCD